MRDALKIAKNPLDELHMSVTGLMHEQADLLGGVGDVRSRQGEILQGAGQALLVSGIGKYMSSRERQLGCGADGRGNRLAIQHVGTL